MLQSSPRQGLFLRVCWPVFRSEKLAGFPSVPKIMLGFTPEDMQSQRIGFSFLCTAPLLQQCTMMYSRCGSFTRSAGKRPRTRPEFPCFGDLLQSSCQHPTLLANYTLLIISPSPTWVTAHGTFSLQRFAPLVIPEIRLIDIPCLTTRNVITWRFVVVT